MPWFKVDDGFHGHPKVMNLEPADVGIWTLAGTWCAQYLTDGQVSMPMIRRLGGTAENCQALVKAELWIANEDGTYQFKDWEDYQPMKSDVEAEREASRERMRKVRAKKKGTDQERAEDVLPNIGRSSEEVRVTPTQPDPAQPPLSKESVPGDETRKKPSRRMPEAWEPNDTHKAYAKAEGINLTFQAERFRTHAESNDRRLVNWDAGFKNWLLKAEKSQTNSPSPWDQKGIH